MILQDIKWYVLLEMILKIEQSWHKKLENLKVILNSKMITETLDLGTNAMTLLQEREITCSVFWGWNICTTSSVDSVSLSRKIKLFRKIKIIKTPKQLLWIYLTWNRNISGRKFKLLTPKQMFQRLPITLAQVITDIIKKVYNNKMNLIIV